MRTDGTQGTVIAGVRKPGIHPSDQGPREVALVCAIPKQQKNQNTDPGHIVLWKVDGQKVSQTAGGIVNYATDVNWYPGVELPTEADCGADITLGM